MHASAFAVATRANIFILNLHKKSRAGVSITIVITKLSLTLGTHVSKSNFYVCMRLRAHAPEAYLENIQVPSIYSSECFNISI